MSVLHTHSRALYAYGWVEERLYIASQQVRPCVIIENVGRKDAERERNECVVDIYIYTPHIHIRIYTT